MIDLTGLVWIVVYILVAAGVFALLFFGIDYVGRTFPNPPMPTACKIAKFVLVIGAILLAVFYLIGLVSGHPMFRWG